jgi:DNA invertase Pin-like site-specific DNA recombinase
MDHWWEIGLPDAHAPAIVRGVAYYRHSAQDRQENSIPIQQDQVRAWAKQHGVEIIREFCDAGRSVWQSKENSDRIRDRRWIP